MTAELFKHIKVFDKAPNENSVVIYDEIFTPPVQLIFKWDEDQWEGKIYRIYTFRKMYIEIVGAFGSCSGCDIWEDLNDIEKANRLIQEVARNCKIYESLDSIGEWLTASDSAHPELVKAFMAFIKNPKEKPKEKPKKKEVKKSTVKSVKKPTKK